MILIIGATGNVGSALVGELKAAGADFKAMARNSEKAAALEEVAELHGNLVDAARESGSPYIVRMSAIKASDDSPMQIGRLHAEADANLEASGLPYTILRPHFFMQNVMMGAQSVASDGKLYMSFGQGELAWSMCAISPRRWRAS